MDNKNLSRREFLRMSAVAAAGLAATPLLSVPTHAAAPVAFAPLPQDVTLDVMTLDEYEGQYKEIWSMFEAGNPGIKINVFSMNEDMAAAHNAKVAGGYLPAIELTTNFMIFANKENYQMFVDLSSFDFPWWDRWTWDVKNTWSDMFGLPGPRTLDIFQGIVTTWMWRQELMEQSGLDPRRDVKTWDDLKKWLETGTQWANSRDDVDYFWDVGWHNFAFGPMYLDLIPTAFPDGQRERQRDCYLGNAKFNAPDSPYRHTFEFFKEANDKGWIPERCWTRQWEADMEGSYIGGKSVAMLHGPWCWDKMLANDPTVIQSGMPATPPAEGQATWIQGATPPSIDGGWFIRTGNETGPNWDKVQVAWNWFNSPEAVPMRSQAEGRSVTYKLDEPLDLKGPQYQGILRDIENPEGAYPEVKWDNGLTGDVAANPYLKKGAKGPWDWQSNNNNQYWADYLTGKTPLQDILDLAQKNWDESYEGLPLPA